MKATIEAPLWRNTLEVLDVVRSGTKMYLIGMTGYRLVDLEKGSEVSKIVFSE